MNRQTPIPKTIHYVWFGGKPLPKLARRCLKSWRKFCPDYKIVCWDESNFDISQNQYVKEAYDAKKFAFVSDYVRLWALYTKGGIYMDADVELIKPLDELLGHSAFTGFGGEDAIPAGLIAASRHNKWVKILLSDYDKIHFVLRDGTFDLLANVARITNSTVKNYNLKLNNKYQDLGDVVIYPLDFFSPKHWLTGDLNITNNTYCIHWFDGSWLDKATKRKRSREQILSKLFSKDSRKKLSHIKRKLKGSS